MNIVHEYVKVTDTRLFVAKNIFTNFEDVSHQLRHILCMAFVRLQNL